MQWKQEIFLFGRSASLPACLVLWCVVLLLFLLLHSFVCLFGHSFIHGRIKKSLSMQCMSGWNELQCIIHIFVHGIWHYNRFIADIFINQADRLSLTMMQKVFFSFFGVFFYIAKWRKRNNRTSYFLQVLHAKQLDIGTPTACYSGAIQQCIAHSAVRCFASVFLFI